MPSGCDGYPMNGGFDACNKRAAHLAQQFLLVRFSAIYQKLLYTNVDNCKRIFDKLRRCFFHEFCFSSVKVN